MKRLIYISNASRPIGRGELAELLDKSRSTNKGGDLSGLLVFHEHRFFQVLEGPDGPVDACFARISKDNRHCRVQVLSDERIEERAFPNWRMGFSRPEELPVQQRSTVFSIYDMIPPNSERRGEDPDVRRQVRDFLASFGRLREPA